MSLSDTQWSFLQDVCKLIEFAKVNQFKLTGGELLRFKDRQEKLIEQGKSWTMNSKHLNKLAIDLNVFVKEPNELMGTGFKWKLASSYETTKSLGMFWESLSEFNEWGGNWLKKNKKPGLDTPHFQRNTTKRKKRIVAT